MKNDYFVKKKDMKIYFLNFKTPPFLIHIMPTAAYLTVFILQNLLLKFKYSLIQQWLISLITSAEGNTL